MLLCNHSHPIWVLRLKCCTAVRIQYYQIKKDQKVYIDDSKLSFPQD